MTDDYRATDSEEVPEVRNGNAEEVSPEPEEAEVEFLNRTNPEPPIR